MPVNMRERACLYHASSQRELSLVQERSVVHRHRLRAALSNTHGCDGFSQVTSERSGSIARMRRSRQDQTFLIV